MIGKRSAQDKADEYGIRFKYYDNGMVMFYVGPGNGEVLAGEGTSRQDAEKLVRARLHALAEEFGLLTPQS